MEKKKEMEHFSIHNQKINIKGNSKEINELGMESWIMLTETSMMENGYQIKNVYWVLNILLDGRGKYYHGLTSDTYEGEWINDRKHGKGTYKFS